MQSSGESRWRSVAGSHLDACCRLRHHGGESFHRPERSVILHCLGFIRRRGILTSLAGYTWGLAVALAFSQPVAADEAFRQWLEALWPEAQGLGVSRATFEAATRGLEPDLALPDLSLPGRPEAPRGQAEFVQTPADYLKESTIASLAAQGR